MQLSLESTRRETRVLAENELDLPGTEERHASPSGLVGVQWRDG